MAQRDGIFAGEDPFVLAQAWLTEAEASEPNDPNAIALATTDSDGLPNVRIVLLKEIEPGPDGGFVFYTNYDGVKGQELAGNPQAAFVMHWKSLHRQIRVRGPVEKVSAEQSDAYYNTRALQSRLGAWASAQSQPLDSRASLMADVAKITATKGPNPPRPPHWGGYRIRPVELEFWADGAFRLHDRFRWIRNNRGEWETLRLYP